MWELINGEYVNQDTGEKLTPEQYELIAKVAPQTEVKGAVPIAGKALGAIGSIVGGYYGGPAGAAAGKTAGETIGGMSDKGGKGNVAEIGKGAAIKGVMSLVASEGADQISGEMASPALSEASKLYSREAATKAVENPMYDQLSQPVTVEAGKAFMSAKNDPTFAQNMSAIYGYGLNKVKGQTSGLIGGDYLPSKQSDSMVANFGEGLFGGPRTVSDVGKYGQTGQLDTIIANAKEGNVASSLGGMAKYTMDNYRPPVKRRRYY